MKKYILVYLTIFNIVAILFSASGCFYRAVTNDISNAMFNGIICLFDILFFTLYFIKTLKEFKIK